MFLLAPAEPLVSMSLFIYHLTQPWLNLYEQLLSLNCVQRSTMQCDFGCTEMLLLVGLWLRVSHSSGMIYTLPPVRLIS